MSEETLIMCVMPDPYGTWFVHGPTRADAERYYQKALLDGMSGGRFKCPAYRVIMRHKRKVVRWEGLA